MTFTDLPLSHSCIVLAVWLGLFEVEPMPQYEVLSALDQAFLLA